MHRKGIVFIFIYKLTNFECSANLKVPSPELVNISKLCGPVRDKVRGLEPRFEALTQFVKSPNTPGGIRTGESSRPYTTSTAHKYFPALPTN